MKWFNDIFHIKENENTRKEELKRFMKECPEGFISYVYGLEMEKIININRI
jgi:hypothetical protein